MRSILRERFIFIYLHFYHNCLTIFLIYSTRMQYALMFAMELATENLQKRLESRVRKQKKCKEGDFDMQSIIVSEPTNLQ